MDKLLQGLRAAAEPTRLRIIALCGHAELSVSDLVTILGQSQPRVSRHLKLLVDGGLLSRNKEGSRAFYRLVAADKQSELGQILNDLIPEKDSTLILDLSRLGNIKADRARYADNYLDQFMGEKNQLKELCPDEQLIDRYLMRHVQSKKIGELLDIGTGTGRMLNLLGPVVETALGIDNSLDMLSIARANLERAGLKNCQVRIADMYSLPFSENRFELVTINSLLRYAERPEKVLFEATRVLKYGGILVIVDFSAHGLSELRDEYGHRWLGFPEIEILTMLGKNNFIMHDPVYFEGKALTVCIWVGVKQELNDI